MGAKAKHTEGPWTTENDGSLVMRGQVIASPAHLCPDDADRAEGIANAKLIAAAPEMLAALEAAEVTLAEGAENCGGADSESIFSEPLQKVRAAIAQAKGGAS